MFYIGIDVSKKTLDVVLLRDPDKLQKRHKTVPNTPTGFANLIAWCCKHSGAEPADLHAVLEPTGVYHEALADALHAAGLVVSVVNPKQIKDFASGAGIKAKNDALDALTMARYAAKMNPPAWQPPAPEQRQLTALLRRLEAVEVDLQREVNRLEHAQLSQAQAPAVIESIERGITTLRTEKEHLKTLIDQHIDDHPDLKQNRDYLESIAGIGPVLSRWLLALLQTGERFTSAAQFASYLGVIPTEHRSGTSVRVRPHLSKLGPATVRAKLYMATLVAVRHNPDVRAFYQRLLARGKCKMAALGGAMRKLAHICFGVIKNQTHFQPQTTQAA